MRKIVFALVFLAPVAAFAEGNEDVCRSDEKSCLAQVLAERLVAAEMRAIQVEAHNRFLTAQPKDIPKAATP